MAAAAVAALLFGCSAPTAPQKPSQKGEAPADAGYLSAPVLLAVTPAADHVRLDGLAQPKAQVRLASPTGEAVFTKTDGEGRWRLDAPVSAQARLLGLSAEADGRRLQAQGYVLITDRGGGALLRSGAGAEVFAHPGPPRLLAVDFDREGGAIVSGVAPAESALSVRVDARPGPVGRADAAGRFSLSLAQPLSGGAHEIQILGDAFDESATIDAAPAPPVEGAAFRATRTPLGLRVDWMTPGGGLQSTWILN